MAHKAHWSPMSTANNVPSEEPIVNYLHSTLCSDKRNLIIVRDAVCTSHQTEHNYMYSVDGQKILIISPDVTVLKNYSLVKSGCR